MPPAISMTSIIWASYEYVHDVQQDMREEHANGDLGDEDHASTTYQIIITAKNDQMVRNSSAKRRALGISSFLLSTSSFR
jgi:hypothetical protein